MEEHRKQEQRDDTPANQWAMLQVYRSDQIRMLDRLTALEARVGKLEQPGPVVEELSQLKSKLRRGALKKRR